VWQQVALFAIFDTNIDDMKFIGFLIFAIIATAAFFVPISLATIFPAALKPSKEDEEEEESEQAEEVH